MRCLTVAAIVLATGVGYRWAWESDEHLTLEQHAALRNAISVLQPSLLKSGDADPRLIRTAEQIAGVKNIKFTSDPDTTDREMQPVVTGDGRIAGFFVWDSSRHMTRAMNRLASVAAVIAFALAGFAAMSLFHLKRAHRELAVREVRRRVRPTRTSSPACRTMPRPWNCWISPWRSSLTTLARPLRS
jgi:hypothetical protein